MKIIIFILFPFVFSLIFTKPVFATPKINEVYPKPNTEEKEWVEIYNDSLEIIDLAGWILMDELSAPSIIFQFDQSLDSWKIEPLSFLVIEIENSKLNNAADGLRLINSLGEVVDQFNYTNSELEMSFSLINQNNQVSNILTIPSKGLPNPIDIDSETVESEISLDIPQTNNEEVQTDYPPLKLYEVMSCPEENNPEWIKVQNQNNEAVNLNNWLLKDSANNQVLLGSNEEIPPHALITIYLTNSILNNSGDLIILLDPNDNIADSLQLGQCSTGISISATDTSAQDEISPPEFTSSTEPIAEIIKNDHQKIDVVNSLAEKVSNLKKINTLLSISNSDKSSTAKTSNYISKQVVVKDNSLPKTAVISVIIGGATLASSGLFFINHEKT